MCILAIPSPLLHYMQGRTCMIRGLDLFVYQSLLLLFITRCLATSLFNMGGVALPLWFWLLLHSYFMASWLLVYQARPSYRYHSWLLVYQARPSYHYHAVPSTGGVRRVQHWSLYYCNALHCRGEPEQDCAHGTLQQMPGN